MYRSSGKEAPLTRPWRWIYHDRRRAVGRCCVWKGFGKAARLGGIICV